MSKLHPVLILKALGWLLTACFTPYSRAVVAQMWPNALPIHESRQGPPGRQRMAGFRPRTSARVGGIKNSFKATVTSGNAVWFNVNPALRANALHCDFLSGLAENSGVRARGACVGRAVLRRVNVPLIAWLSSRPLNSNLRDRNQIS